MGRIYNSAHTVLAYLGLGNGKTTLAIQTLNRISSLLLEHMTGENTTIRWMESYLEIWRWKDGKCGQLNAFWNGIVQLMSSTYWTRAWILQEMALASQLHLLTGGGATAACQTPFDIWVVWHVFVLKLREKKGNRLPMRIPSLLFSMGSQVYVLSLIHI